MPGGAGVGSSRGDRRGLAVVLGAAGLASFVSLVLRVPCLVGPWGEGREYRRLCYSDLQALWHARDLAAGRLPYVEEFVEYPTLTGVEMWLTARVVAADTGFVLVNAVVLGACALVAAWALYRATGSAVRTLPFAAGTSLALYAVFNWELLAVAPLCVGFLLWRRGRHTAAGAAFGLGAAAKLFPAAALPLGAAWLWQRGMRREAVWFVAAGVGVLAIWNLPFAVANPDGWWATYAFHRGRFPDFGTLWYWLWEATGQQDWDGFRSLADRAGFAAMALAGVGVLALQWWRRLPIEASTGVLVAVFLIVTKVHSPQYALWILPFLVLVERSAALAVAYQAVDLVLFVSGFQWIATAGFPGPHPWRTVFAAAVVARAVLLAGAALRLARQPPAIPEPSAG